MMNRFTRTFFWMLVIAFGVLGPNSLSGARFADNEYLIDSWETEQGLPENSATAMVQTPDGYLWFGTFNGLVRFDGVKFTVFDPQNTPGLPSPGIVNLHLDGAQRLWVSTYRGLVVSEPYRWTQFRPEPGWTADYVRTSSENAGTICFTSFNGKIFRSQGGRFEELPAPFGHEGGGFLSYVDRTGRIWVAGNRFFGHWEGTQWHEAELAAGLFPDFVSLTRLRDGTLLMLKDTELWSVDEGKVVARRSLSVPPDTDFRPRGMGSIWSMHDDREGNIWLCGRRLYRLRPSGELRSFQSADRADDWSLRFAFEDREANLWLGTSGGGLMRLKHRRFLNYGSESGLSDRNVKAVIEEEPGRFVFGTYGGGLNRWEQGQVSVAATNGQPFSRWVQCLLKDRAGNLWVGSYAGRPEWSGLTIIRPNGRQAVTAEEGGGGSINALFQDAQGHVWIGAQQTVSVFADGKFTLHSPTNGIRLAGIRCFAEDPPRGVLWAGSAEGLFRFADGSWHEVRNAQGARVTDVLSLRTDTDGTLWIGGAGMGLLRLKDGRWSSITVAHGLPTSSISCMLEDDSGYWWLGSNRGVIRALGADLRRTADGTLTKLPCQVFNLCDGLASVECTLGYPSTGLKDSQGRLWFATLKGAAMVDPRQLRLNPYLPPVLPDVISYVDRMGKRAQYTFGPSAPAQGRGRPDQAAPFTIPAGARQLEAQFAALSFAAPEKVRLRYVLARNGTSVLVDEGPNRTTGTHWLPPGDYQLQVSASNDDNLWNEKGTTLAFVVEPYYWQTLWFRGLALAGLAGGAGLTARQVTRAKLRRRIERLEHERALAQERARLATVMEATTDFVGFADREGRVLFLNAAGRAMVGLAQDEDLRQSHLRDLAADAARQKELNAGLFAAVNDGVWSGEMVFRHPSGREITVSLVVVAHRASDGELDFVSIIARDITTRKEAEQALIESESRFRSLSEAAFEGVMVHEQGIIMDANLQFARLFGYETPAELIGRDGIKLLLTPASQAEIKHRMASGTLSPMEVTGVRKDGSTFLGETQSRESVYLDRKVRVVTMRDITERKRVEEERAQLQNQLIQAQKMEAVGQLAGGVAHDFNNILAVILMQVGLLQGESKLAPDVQTALKELEDAARRAANLTRQLLLFSRRQVMQKRLLDLDSLLGNLLHMLRRLIGEHISLEFKGGSKALWVEADAGMLDQVIVNLTVNARDATPNGGRITFSTGEVELKVGGDLRHPEARPGCFVCLSVSDTGCGMDDATLKRIFEPFFTTKEPGKGTGIGLATVYGIVKQHGGWVEVQSAVNRGTTFQVFLPAATTGACAAMLPEVSEPPPRGTETLLVVEDDPSVRGMLHGVLTAAGYRVIVAVNGREALTLWDQHRDTVDVLVSDMVMPEGLTGLDLAERLRQTKPELKVMIVSGYSLEIAQRGLPTGDQQIVYLSKPFDAAVLKRTVRQCLDRR